MGAGPTLTDFPCFGSATVVKWTEITPGPYGIEARCIKCAGVPEQVQDMYVNASICSLGNWAGELEAAVRIIEHRLLTVLGEKQLVYKPESYGNSLETDDLAGEIRVQAHRIRAICQDVNSIIERIEL